MNRLITIILLVAFHSVHAQVEKDIPIFHRLLVFNAQNELLVVKIENTDLWVTPGLYLTKEQTIKEGLDSIASTYGLVLKEHKLKGTFILKRQVNGENSTSLRNVFTARIKSGSTKKPEGIEEVKWLSGSEALEIISFPHINAMIKQIVSHPDEIWGGTLLQYKENDTWNTKIVEQFYTL